jgi:hypothetical protein
MLDQHVAACHDCRELLSALATGTTSVTPSPPGAGDAPSHLTGAASAAGSGVTAPRSRWSSPPARAARAGLCDDAIVVSRDPPG